MAGSDAEPKAQCVECGEILSNEVLKPSTLRRHLNTKHLGCVGGSQKNISQGKATSFKRNRVITILPTQLKATVNDSYMVAARGARSKKPFTTPKRNHTNTESQNFLKEYDYTANKFHS